MDIRGKLIFRFINTFTGNFLKVDLISKTKSKIKLLRVFFFI
jgi:hypothetical protein